MKENFDKIEKQNQFWKSVEDLGAISRKKGGNNQVTAQQFHQMADAIADSFDDFTALSAYVQIVAAMKKNDLSSLYKGLQDLKKSNWYVSLIVKFPTKEDHYHCWGQENRYYNKNSFPLDEERKQFVEPYLTYLSPAQKRYLS